MKIKLLILILVAIGVTACTGLQGAVTQEPTIKIGAILPLEGYGASVGEDSLKGYELAIKEINAQGGVLGKPVELVVESHIGDDTQAALAAYRKLRIQQVDIILGPSFAPLGQAMAPIACEDRVLLISSSIGIKDFAPTCDTIFNFWPPDFENSKLLGEIVSARGHEQIAVVGSTQSWELEQAEAVREGLRNKGVEPGPYIIADNANQDFSTEATKIINANADAVVFTNYGYLPLLTKRLRELGSEAQFYVVIIDESRKEGSRGSMEGIIAITSFTPSSEFKQLFFETYGEAADFSTDTSYDSLLFIAEHIEKTGSTDTVMLSQSMLQQGSYSGASGVLEIQPDGTVRKESAFQQVLDNKIVNLENFP